MIQSDILASFEALSRTEQEFFVLRLRSETGGYTMLKHLSRIELRDKKDVYIDDAGLQVDLLPRFIQWLRKRGLAETSIERYSFAAARFIDYLIEVDVFGRDCSVGRMADAIDAYPLFLRDGARMEWPEFPTLPTYAVEIGLGNGISGNASVPTIAAVNHLLTFAKDDALRTMTALQDSGCAADFSDLSTTFRAIDGVTKWSAFEKARFKQSSVMGGVVRIKSELTRPRGLRSAIRGGKQLDLEAKEFPIQYLPALLDAARSYRDRVLWALLAGGGLRVHEALNLRLDEIDLVAQRLFVRDPEERRFPGDVEPREQERFKGRVVSRVVLFEPVATIFWQALEEYLRNEFVPVDGDNHLFQQRASRSRGLPLSEASDTALQAPFKRAVIELAVPGPQEAPDHVWTLHSLRHLYGVYMLNYIPVPGGPGLRLTEVQQLMGHARIESTRVYARHQRDLMEAKVAAGDQAVFNGWSAEEALRSMPDMIADRLRLAADELASQSTRTL